VVTYPVAVSEAPEFEAVRTAAQRAAAAAPGVRAAGGAAVDAALRTAADLLREKAPELLAANGADVEAGEASGMAAGLLDRLRLTPERLADMATQLEVLADTPEPPTERYVRDLPTGERVFERSIPVGVIGAVFEARPNVTVDVASQVLKARSAAVLRTGAAALGSATALVENVIAPALTAHGIPADAVQLVPGSDHESVKHLMRLRGLVDVLIPRGGAGLIRAVVEESTVPVIETGVGNCHVYVDKDADLDMAVEIALNSKAQRVSVCNSAETLLVHLDVADRFLPKALAALTAAGVTIHGDDTVRAVDPTALAATEEDWAAEYLALDLAVKVVPSLDAATEHIRRYGSGHTEAIVTRSLAASRRFIAGCDSAAIMVNASTRFTDGERFGMGAEIGISTQKLHARGPMGLAELTSTKYLVVGDGQIRETS